jgi:hypothetical protein
MMVFLRTKKIKNKNYYYIVEAFREGGKIKQKVLMYIGTVESMLKKLKIANEVLKKKP